MVSVAPLSLSRAPSASVIGVADSSAEPRRVDPLAAHQAAMEKNTREVREEREAAAREKAEAAKAAQAKADAVAKAQADAAAKEQVPEGQAPTGGAGGDQSALERGGGDSVVLERGGGDSVVLEVEVPPRAPTTDARGSRPEAPPVSPSGGAAAELQQRLDKVQTELHAKEQEYSQAAQECDRLPKELADQAEQHKAELQKLKEEEDSLKAEFKTQCSNWAEKEKFLTDGHEFLPGHSVAISQDTEARRDMRRRAGPDIAPNPPRNLGEQLLTVKTHLQPAQRMLHRLQRARVQVLTALWPDAQVPCTLSQTADWLEVAAGRFEAWKGAAAQAGAWTALEFTKAWYAGLDLAQLATFRQEAGPELLAVGRALTQRAATIAEYANSTVFIPELDEEGAEVPSNWFGLNRADGEDLAEEIASSDEGEDKEDEDDEYAAPENRPEPDQASTSELCNAAPTAADADQAETSQSAAPTSSAAASASLSDPPAAPLA
nr:uncharacterized protein LOC109769223 [Aegilops tauschii subsp. strangulata]